MAQEELWLALKADIGDVKGKLNSITSEGNKTTSVLSSGFKKLGVIIAGAFAIGSIIKFASSSLTAFMDTEKSALSLANTLKNVAGISQSGIKEIGNAVNKLEIATAFDDVEINNAIKNMLLRFGDMELVLKSLPVAMEMARSTGEDLNSMMTLLGQGFQGQARGLRQFGITTVEGKTKLEILEAVMSKVRGSMNTFANTTAGAVEDMRTSWGNLKELVGGVVAPVFAGFTSELATLLSLTMSGVSVNKEFGESLKEIGGVFAKLIMTIANMTGWLFRFGKVLGAVLDPRATIKDINKQIDAWGELEKSTFDMWTEQGKYAPEARKSMEEILAEAKKLSTGLKGIGSEAEETGEKIKEAFKPAWQPITLIGGNLPELSKFIGNLRYAQPIITRKTVYELNVNVIDKSKAPTETSRAVAKVFYDIEKTWATKKILPLESHGTGSGGKVW